ncbi:acyltransferase family protein [Shinella sp.]|uniref:acyltransferase family protein n=1 Tax=Shinella sp. TaxID=1870904 RepID=UPI003F70B398
MTQKAFVKRADLLRMARVAKELGVVVSQEQDGVTARVSPFDVGSPDTMDAQLPARLAGPLPPEPRPTHACASQTRSAPLATDARRNSALYFRHPSLGQATTSKCYLHDRLPDSLAADFVGMVSNTSRWNDRSIRVWHAFLRLNGCRDEVMGMGALRLVLAVSVVCAHSGGVFGYDMATGRGAVQGFFMLSGFLMQLVLAEKYNPRSDILLFYSNRAIRIYPTYFLALIFSAMISALLFRYSSGFFYEVHAAMQVLTPFDWAKVVLSHIFIIGQDTFVFQQLDTSSLNYITVGVGNAAEKLLLLPPAWSISLELTFYLLAPFLARLSTSWLLFIVATAFSLRCIGWWNGLAHDPWTNRFFPFEIALFVGGMVSYRCRNLILGVLGSRGQRHVFWIALVGALSVHPGVIAATRLHVHVELVYLVFYGFVFCVLPGLFERSKNSRLDSFLGSFSFPVYLLHWPILLAYNAFAGTHQDIYQGTLRTIACLIITFSISYAVVILVELPLERLRSRRKQSGNVDARLRSIAEIGP